METRPERGEAEVHEVQRAVRADARAGVPEQQVVGLHVAVHDAGAVHRRQPRQRLVGDHERRQTTERPAALTAQDISSSDGPSRSITSTRLAPEHALPAEVVHAREPRGTGVLRHAREHRAL